MITRLARIRQALIGWIYPPVCGACEIPLDAARQLEKPFLCGNCEATLGPIGRNYCAVCGQGFELETAAPFRCANCGDRELAIDFAVMYCHAVSINTRSRRMWYAGLIYNRPRTRESQTGDR